MSLLVVLYSVKKDADDKSTLNVCLISRYSRSVTQSINQSINLLHSDIVVHTRVKERNTDGQTEIG